MSVFYKLPQSLWLQPFLLLLALLEWRRNRAARIQSLEHCGGLVQNIKVRPKEISIASDYPVLLFFRPPQHVGSGSTELFILKKLWYLMPKYWDVPKGTVLGRQKKVPTSQIMGGCFHPSSEGGNISTNNRQVKEKNRICKYDYIDIIREGWT